MLKRMNIKLALFIALGVIVVIAFLVAVIDPAVFNMFLGAAILVALFFVMKLVISFIHLPFGFLLKPDNYLVVRKGEVSGDSKSKSPEKGEQQ